MEPTISSTEAAQRAREIEQAQRPTVSDREDRIGRALDQLEGALSNLAERLVPVLAEPEVVPATPALAEEPAPSMHAQRLARLATWAERLVVDVRHLTERVDL